MINRRNFLKYTAGLSAISLLSGCSEYLNAPGASVKKPNILLITADDMSYDSLGCTGCTIPDISPHLDGLHGMHDS